MLQRQYTAILNKPIVLKDTGEELGEIYDIIIDETTGKIEAFWVKQGFFSGSSKILALSDIFEWKIKIYVNDADAIINPEEIVKVKEIISRNIPIYWQKVRTLAGVRLGRVTEIFFDPIGNRIHQIQVAKVFCGFKFSKRLVPFSEIYEITKKAVILKDDFKYAPFKVKEILDLREAM